MPTKRTISPKYLYDQLRSIYSSCNDWSIIMLLSYYRMSKIFQIMIDISNHVIENMKKNAIDGFSYFCIISWNNSILFLRFEDCLHLSYIVKLSKSSPWRWMMNKEKGKHVFCKSWLSVINVLTYLISTWKCLRRKAFTSKKDVDPQYLSTTYKNESKV